jgi:hypothetical protein
MSARLVLAGRLGLDPARGLNREPKALSQSGICHARERWRGEMIGGALLPVKSMAKEGPFRVDQCRICGVERTLCEFIATSESDPEQKRR